MKTYVPCICEENLTICTAPFPELCSVVNCECVYITKLPCLYCTALRSSPITDQFIENDFTETPNMDCWFSAYGWL